MQRPTEHVQLVLRPSSCGGSISRAGRGRSRAFSKRNATAARARRSGEGSAPTPRKSFVAAQVVSCAQKVRNTMPKRSVAEGSLPRRARTVRAIGAHSSARDQRTPRRAARPLMRVVERATKVRSCRVHVKRQASRVKSQESSVKVKSSQVKSQESSVKRQESRVKSRSSQGVKRQESRVKSRSSQGVKPRSSQGQIKSSPNHSRSRALSS